MKKSILALSLTSAIAIGLYSIDIVDSPDALADNTDTATVNVGGTVVRSLTLTKVKDVTMADIVAPDAGETTSLGMTCSNIGAPTLTYDNRGGNPFANGVSNATGPNTGSSANFNGPGTTGTCAELTVSGEPNFNFVATYTGPTGTVTPAGVSVTSVNCTANANFAGTIFSGQSLGLGAAGTNTLYCGANVVVQPGTAAGPYSGASFNVTVTYD